MAEEEQNLRMHILGHLDRSVAQRIFLEGSELKD